MGSTGKGKKQTSGIRHADDFLTFVRAYTAENGYPPSYAEIGDALGLRSKGTVFNLIRRMKEQGLINVQPGLSRTITLP